MTTAAAAAAAATAAATAALSPPQAKIRDAVGRIARAALDILAHPPVVITPEALDVYIETHLLLRTASTLPAALEMYGSKPLPSPSSSSSAVVYRTQNPRRAAAAIPDDVAAKALDAAIAARNLDSAVAVAETCYDTAAFTRHKLLRDGARPGVAVASTPPLAYVVASGMAHHGQVAVEPATATAVAFLGIMAYCVFTGTLAGLARMDTDHMVRVTWAPGTSVWTRWVREEHRAGLDRIACAWGFQDRSRHGEEQGPEWAALREYVLYRGMILDRVEFMEGVGGA